jgi:hypothetical protein
MLAALLPVREKSPAPSTRTPLPTALASLIGSGVPGIRLSLATYSPRCCRSARNSPAPRT